MSTQQLVLPTRLSHRRRLAVVLAVVALVATGLFASPQQAEALGTKQKICVGFPGVLDSYIVGTSTTSYVRTSVTTAGQCGNKGVRAQYRIVAGGTIYYTAWTYASGTVTQFPGNIIIGAGHTCTAPAALYTGNFPFTT